MFTGSLGDFTAYKIKDSDKIYVRRKGGVSAKRVRNAPEFANTRRLNSEFAARASFAGRIVRSLPLLRPFADRKTCGTLNKLVKQIQDRDTGNAFGTRCIALSRFPALLEGFSFNAIYSFDSFVSASVSHSINVEASEVTVVILRP